MILTKRPVAVLLVLSALMLPAVFSFLNIPLELNPEVERPELNITTPWKGAPPELVVREITIPVETEAAKIKGVYKITSSSRLGKSTVTVQFNPGIDIGFARFELNERISQIRREFPTDAGYSEISNFDIEREREKTFLRLSIVGDYSLVELRKIVTDNLLAAVQTVEGVSKAEVIGGQELEVVIELNPRLLQHYKINAATVAAAINSHNMDRIPGNVIKNGEKRFMKIISRPASLEDIRNMMITTGEGTPVKIGDLGTVELKKVETTSISRTNMKTEVSLEVYRTKNSNAVQVSNAVLEKMEKAINGLPYDIDFSVVTNEGAEITREISGLLLRVGLIIFLVLLLLLLILRNLHMFLILFAVIILTEAATFNLLYFTGVSVNFLTLAALAIGLGIVVDNAIVILENIHQKMSDGLPLDEAISKGTSEMIRPVLASTMTTLAVFIPFVLFSGRLREYYVPLAQALVYSLVSSLIISFLFIPAASRLFLKAGEKNKFKRQYLSFYKKFTRWSLQNSYVILIVITIIGYYSLLEFDKLEKGRWAYGYSNDKISVSVHLPRGSEIERTDEIIRKFEKIYKGVEGIKTVSTSIFQNMGFISVEFKPDALRSYLPYQLREATDAEASRHAGCSVGVGGFTDPYYSGGMSYQSFGSSGFVIRGYNLEELHLLADDISKRVTNHIRVRKVNRSTDNRGWGNRTNDELLLELDKKKIAHAELSPRDIQENILLGLGQQSGAAQVLLGDKRYNVRIEEKNAGNIQLEDLKQKLTFFESSKSGRLGSFFTAGWYKAPDTIYRENQEYRMRLGWDYRGPSAAGQKYEEAIYASTSLPPGYAKEKTDREYLTVEETSDIYKVLLISLGLVFMILASLYESLIQPFIILFSIPLALIGVFLIFSYTSSSFTSSAYIGVILLCGMVVNNAIIMVDRYNHLLAGGMPLENALVEGTFSRIRPIILTTTTTIGGLLPMVLTRSQTSGDIWYDLALSSIGGLISSALFSITLIPIIYRFFHGLKKHYAEKAIMYKSIINRS